MQTAETFYPGKTPNLGTHTYPLWSISTYSLSGEFRAFKMQLDQSKES